MDPMGADVTENPYLVYQNPSYLNLKEGGERLFDEGDDPFSVGSGCSLDGMPVSCSYLNRRLDDGSVQTQYVGLYERDPNLTAAAPNRFVPTTRDIRNHGLGIYEIWMPPEFRNEYSTGGWVLVPQGWAPIGGLDRMQMWLEEALKYRDCREALQKVLAQIGSDTKFAPSHTDILDVFNTLRGQTGGGGV